MTPMLTLLAAGLLVIQAQVTAPLTSDRSFLSGKQIAIEFPAGLDDAGRARLTEIASVLERRGTAAFAVALGFIQLDQWPEPDSLCIYPLGSYASSPNLAEVGS